MLYKNICQSCGGTVEKIGEKYVCQYCRNEYSIEKFENYAEKIRQLFDDFKLEMISNAKKNLYNAITAQYISSEEVHECCTEVKKYLPDDFQANFFDAVVNSTPKNVAKLINQIDEKEYFDSLDLILDFLINSLTLEWVTPIAALIERGYKDTNLRKYNKYSSMLESETEKIDECIYLTTYPRDVFVAYSSKDIDKALELVDVLEEQGLSCFISIRNLRHGAGSRENYEIALKEAMDNCSCFVFVSSMNSRNSSCDALRVEIPYIKRRDIENATGYAQSSYVNIPHEFKKSRVEYRLEESNRLLAADRIVDEFFSGYERVYEPMDVAERVMRQFSAPIQTNQNPQVDIAKLIEEQVRVQREAEKRKEEEERRKLEEATRIEEERRRLEEIRIRQEAENRSREELARREREEKERKRKKEEEEKRIAEEERKRRDKEEQRCREEAERKRREKEALKRKEQERINRLQNKVKFGSYPQVKVKDIRLISALNNKVGKLPSKWNSYEWTSFDYYTNGKVEKFMWYIDVEYGTEKYRGVYFTSYRPKIISGKASADTINNGYIKKTLYWFKYEPISWIVLGENQESKTKLMICEMIMDSQHFNTDENNYAESTVRTWLNKMFYNTAFTEQQKQSILTTTIDNSTTSTGYDLNGNACNDIDDRVFLLSYQDIINEDYGFLSDCAHNDIVRQKKATDYAKVQGVRINIEDDSVGDGCWWLRSPFNTGSSFVRGVDCKGCIDDHFYVRDSGYGIVPALQIKL